MSITATLACTCATVTFTATALQPAPTSIQPYSGDLQSDTAGMALDEPLVAQVFTAGATPLPGAQVVWTVIRGGSLSVDTTVSDIDGLVSANYTLGTLTGVDSIEAKTVGGGLTFVFTASVTNDLPALIAIQSGDGQADTTGYALQLPLVALLQLGLVALTVAWNLLDYPLSLQGFPARARLRLIRRHAGAAFGFGLCFAGLSLVPLAAVVLLPVGVVAATQLAHGMLAGAVLPDTP